MKYRAYPAYKDSGLEWLGDVPEHWKTDRLRRVCVRVTDGAHSSPDLSGSDFPFVSTVDISEGRIDFDSCQQTSADSYHYLVRLGCGPSKGDVLFSKDGTVGKTTIVDFESDFVVASSLVIITPKMTLLESRFLNYWLKGSLLQQHILLQLSGAALRRISVEKVSRLQVVLLPLSEQNAIADFLDRETSKLDKLLAMKRALIEKLKEKRTALISRTVTRGLPPEVARPAGFEPHPKLKASSVEWLGEVPEHWKVTRLKHAAARIVDCPHETPAYSSDGDYTVIRTADLTSGSVNLSSAYRIDEDEYRKRIRRECVFENDIVYGREGERWGFAALVPSSPVVCLGQRMMQFRGAAHFDARFLMWQLNAGSVYTQGAVDTMGATSPHVNVQTIRNYWLTEPPPHEQRAVADFLDRETAKIDLLIEKIQMAVEKLQEYRTALITAAVTGKIDVREAV